MVSFFPAEFFSFSAPISKIDKLGFLVWGYSTIDWQTRTHMSHITTDFGPSLREQGRWE